MWPGARSCFPSNSLQGHVPKFKTTQILPSMIFGLSCKKKIWCHGVPPKDSNRLCFLLHRLVQSLPSLYRFLGCPLYELLVPCTIGHRDDLGGIKRLGSQKKVPYGLRHAHQIVSIATHMHAYTIIYHILSYTIIHYHILSYTIIYYHILSYTIIYCPTISQ